MMGFAWARRVSVPRRQARRPRLERALVAAFLPRGGDMPVPLPSGTLGHVPSRAAARIRGDTGEDVPTRLHWHTLKTMRSRYPSSSTRAYRSVRGR